VVAAAEAPTHTHSLVAEERVIRTQLRRIGRETGGREEEGEDGNGEEIGRV
jgi:hypothetical protein